MIPQFVKILDQMKEIHERKNLDYAAQRNQFENFERSALLAEWFEDSVDKSFMVLIGTKLARIATLKNRGGLANNESLEDSMLDLCTYCTLWYAWYMKEKQINVP